MFDADRPIAKSEQDRLNRAQFARYLARCMLEHKVPESLVVGLYGGWGVGKTSIINMIVEELDYAASNMPADEKPIMLNFSAWSYSGQHELIYSFFRRLSSALRHVDYLENSERIIQLLELYVSFFTHKPVPKSLQPKRSLWDIITFQHHEDIYAWESGRDLTQVKAELNQLLGKQKHKIIIIIDNMSRLYAEEIKQLFQIVKSMGDYSNTAYLLAFDKEQVVHTLNKMDGSGGAEFVEKIVQLPFEVPPILQQDIESIFADRLNQVIATIPADTWNSEYWSDMYYSSLKYFFKNCRDISRYVNTLSFSYSRSRDIVNPMDFFALTAIEVFLPSVYAGIRDNKDLFTDLLDNVYALDQDQIQKEKSRCDEILSRIEHVSHEHLLELVMRLFPRLQRIYRPGTSFYHSNTLARRLRRVCSPDLFDVYFRLSMQSGQILESEFETILAMAADENAFEQALTRLNQDDRILKFLDLLDSKAIHHIPPTNAQAVVNALLENGDLFPQGISSPLSLDTPKRIHRIIHELLRSYETAEERFAILQMAIAKANKSIYLTVHELREQSRQHVEIEDTYLPLEFRDLLPEQLESLRKLAVTRIEYWAQNGSLADHPQLLPILKAWRDWGSEEKCRGFIEQMTKSDRGLIAFLSAILNDPVTQAMTKHEKSPLWEKYLEDITHFIAPSSLVNHARVLFEDAYFEKLREREQLALMIFLDLSKAKTNKTIPRTTV